MGCEYPCRNRSGDRLWSGFNRARGQPITAGMRGRKVQNRIAGLGYAGAQDTQMMRDVQAGRYAGTSGKTGGTADKSLFVPGRFMDLPGTFCIMCSSVYR